MGVNEVNGISIKKHITNSDANRQIILDISEDGTKAFISTFYDEVSADTPKEEVPVIYTAGEIRKALAKEGIVHGIIDEAVMKCGQVMGIKKMLVAAGAGAEDDEEDEVNIKYEDTRSDRKYEADHTGKVNYRNVGKVTAVHKGDIIAELIIGKEGHDGIDVYGKAIIRKKKKGKILKAGEGCIVKEGNKIEALIDGEPYVKGNTFNIFEVHTVKKDVSLKTGDIIFIGDVKIQGNVLDGMKVEAGNSVTIEGNTEKANITAKGDILITGNSIGATITAGGKDMKIYKYICLLEETRDIINSLMDTVAAIKKNNLLETKTTDGELIKLLIEKKFSELPRRCWSVLRESYEINNGEADPLSDTIKGKLIGLGPLQIKHYTELEGIVDMINIKIEEISDTLALPVNINIGYCQDCNIQSSGDITVTGLGEYVSSLIADNGIYFIKDGSIARGGLLKANTEISCKTVGSQGGVKTKLIVGKDGHIRIDLAYPNTIISVGGKEFVINVPSTNVHAYINSDRELVVDRFKK